MPHVYDWKHGWVPLDHTAALSKAKGDHKRAAVLLEAARTTPGIQNRRDVAGAVQDLPNVPRADLPDARSQLRTAADRLNAQDLLPSRMNTSASRAEDLSARAAAKRAEAERIAGGAGVADTAAARLNAKNLATAHRNTDSQLRRYSELSGQAYELEHKAALARAREAEASRQHFTAEELRGATHVKDQFGWHEVVRINGKTVTVKTGHSWTDSIAHGKILAVGRPHPTEPGKLRVSKPGGQG